MKRGSAILFMFLAITVILAHSFIPHTHHEDHVCLASIPCQLTCEQERPDSEHPEPCPTSCQHNHNDTGHTHCRSCGSTDEHHHDRHSDPVDCGLSNILVYSPPIHKPHSTCNCCNHGIDHKNFTSAVSVHPGANISTPGNNLPFRHKPYLAAAGRLDAEHCAGPRAPPHL